MHGSLRTISCLTCSAIYDSSKLLPQNPTWEDDYKQGNYHYGAECRCAKCGGLLRPDVVLFGENLPVKAWEKAANHSKDADFYIVLGSSLAVSPANYLPQLALEKGAKLLIVNQEPTPLDNFATYFATWVIHSKIDNVLCAIKDKMMH